MYSVFDYGRMVADPVRMDAFRRALAETVRPGAIVLDLGAGTGIMSILALKAGAARVHAVDPNPAVWLVPELAAENGFAGRVTVHQESSIEMEVPEKVDVVVSDMRGPSPLLEQNLSALRDVRERWLAPGGVVMPARDRLKVVLVEAEGMARRLEDGWAAFARYGVSAAAMKRSILNQAYSDAYAPVSASDVLTTEGTWFTIDYAAPPRGSVDGATSLDVVRGGTALALSLFFEVHLTPNVSYTTAPGHAVIYSRYHLPLEQPVVVERGDRVDVTLRADATGERWAWDTRVTRGGVELCAQRQATFLGAPASLEALLRSSEASTPRLGKRGACVRDLLSAMDGTRTLRELADGADGRVAEPLELVRNLALRYGA